MKGLKRLSLILAVVAVTIVPASPASAAHRCGLEDVDPLVNALCGAHIDDTDDIKLIINYLACFVSPTC